MDLRKPNETFDVAVQSDWDEWHINGAEAAVDTATGLNATFNDWGHDICPYCSSVLACERYTDLAEHNAKWHLDRTYILGLCTRCAFWWFRGLEQANRCMDAPTAALLASVAAKCETDLPNGCAEELAQHLRRHPHAWHTMSPKSLEQLVAHVFRSNYAQCDVMHVGKPGDLGIDVLFVDHGLQTWLIQVKRRSRPGRAEGFSTLQSILGTLALEGCRHGVLVTTADYFSEYVRRQARRAREQGFIIELIDKSLLDRMLGPILPRHPWLTVFEQPLFAALDDEVRRYFLDRIPDLGQGALFDRHPAASSCSSRK